jgi:GTP-binding protein
MSEGPPLVVLLGRQNVGKSTLANRLIGRRIAIADEAPGVTRDRVELEATWRGRRFRLVDTGGFAGRARGLDELVVGQAETAAERADVIVLVVDAHAGIRQEDEHLARRLRRARVPVLLAANKVDSERDEPDAAAFHALGLGEPLAVSALDGRGSGDLLDRIVELLPERGDADGDAIPRFALVGRANVGKSSLFNRLVEEDRAVVFEQAGTTRDAVDAVVRWPEGPVRFVDTAGIRRASRARGVEYYSLLRTMRAVERSDVVALVLDATDGFTTEDRRIAARVMDAGRGLVVVANKWDVVRDRDRVFKELEELAGPFARADVVRTSALTGAGVGRLRPILGRLHERWRRRVPTAAVVELLQAAQADRAPPSGARAFRYATQVGSGPPVFVVFGRRTPDASYRRFLEGRLRRAFGFEGVPIRLLFRERR